MMDVIRYTGTDNQERKAVDIISLIAEMEILERWNGTAKERILDNWYTLKRELAEALNAKMPEAKKDNEAS